MKKLLATGRARACLSLQVWPALASRLRAPWVQGGGDKRLGHAGPPGTRRCMSSAASPLGALGGRVGFSTGWGGELCCAVRQAAVGRGERGEKALRNGLTAAARSSSHAQAAAEGRASMLRRAQPAAPAAGRQGRQAHRRRRSPTAASSQHARARPEPPEPQRGQHAHFAQHLCRRDALQAAGAQGRQVNNLLPQRALGRLYHAPRRARAQQLFAAGAGRGWMAGRAGA